MSAPSAWPQLVPPSVTYCTMPPVTEWDAPLAESAYRVPVPVLLFLNASYPYNSTGLTIIDLNLCARGYVFLGIVILGALLGVISLACLLTLITVNAKENYLRKLLFTLLALVGLTRMIYCAIEYSNIVRATTYRELFDATNTGNVLTFPMNALSDLLQSFIDFILTFFWLDMLNHSVLTARYSKWIPLCVVASVCVIGLVCVSLDFDEVDIRKRYHHLYVRTLAFSASLLLFSAVLHTGVVISLLRKMLQAEMRDMIMGSALRKQVFLVSFICLASMVCMIGRAIVLIGRVSNVAYFVNGPLSFANPDFAAAYFIGLLNLPPMAVAVAFFLLTLELLPERQQRGGWMDVRDSAGPSLTPRGSIKSPRSNPVVTPRASLLQGLSV